MIDILSNVRTVKTSDHRIELTGKAIRDLVSQELAAQGVDRLPANATVTVGIPGGGDYSNMDLDIDDRIKVVVSWTEIERS